MQINLPEKRALSTLLQKAVFQPVSIAVLLLSLIILTGCKTPVQEKQQKEEDPYEKPLLNMNKYMKEKHRDQITAFIDRTGWEMQESSSGLWYQVLQKGDGPIPEEGDRVVYAYQTRLLDGTLCYQADTIHPETIVIGNGSVITGLAEGLSLLQEGAVARLIIPPYLAHGNFGDRDCIPGSAILLIHIRVMEVN